MERPATEKALKIKILSTV